MSGDDCRVATLGMGCEMGYGVVWAIASMGCPNRSLVYGYNPLCCRRLMRYAVADQDSIGELEAAIAELRRILPELGEDVSL